MNKCKQTADKDNCKQTADICKQMAESVIINVNKQLNFAT